MKTHAERFLFLMKLWNLTQQEMGDLCGLGRGTIATIVAGKTKPDVDALALLAEKKGLQEAWLLRGEGEPFVDSDSSTMLRDNKEYTPVAKASPAAPMQVVAEPAEVVRLKESLAQKDEMIELLKSQLRWTQSLVPATSVEAGKEEYGNYAAEPSTRPIGFQTAATITPLEDARLFMVDDRMYFAADGQSIPVCVQVSPVTVQQSQEEAA